MQSKVNREVFEGEEPQVGASLDPESLENGKHRRAVGNGFSMGLLGVLPICGFVAEFASRMYSSACFDVFPTPWHAAGAGCALVAILSLFTMRHEPKRWLALRVVAVGYATGAALLYGLLMLPTAPVIVIGIFLFGLGMLALAPYLALIAGLVLTIDLGRCWREAGRGRASFRFLFGVGLLAFPAGVICADWRVVRGVSDLSLAVHGGSEERLEAVQRLQSAPRRLLVDACYHGVRGGPWRGRFFGFVYYGRPAVLVWPLWHGVDVSGVEPSDARRVFYRVTGRPFSDAEVPRRRHHGFVDGRVVAEFEDAGGDDERNGVIRQLELAESALDVRVDGTAAVATLDWTMTLHNRGLVEREARIGLRVPDNAVASALSLWVDGVEQKAAFGGEAKTVAAYAQIAQRQRLDPVLLREPERGRLRILASPVPPKGEMKFRLGLTIPLLVDGGRALLRLPLVFDRNVRMAEESAHLVSIAFDGRHFAAFARDLEDTQQATCSFAPPNTSRAVYTADRGGVLVQTWRDRPIREWRGPLVLVVDGSVTVDGEEPNWSEIANAWPVGSECVLIHAGQAVTSHVGRIGSQATRAWLSQRQYAGGVDPVPALSLALKLTAGFEARRIVWVHGGQPFLFGGEDELIDLVEERDVSFLTIARSTQRNRLVERLTRAKRAITVPRFGELAEDVRRLAGRGVDEGALGPSFGTRARVIRRVAAAPPDAVPARDPALARAWAAAESRRLVADGDVDQARDLAVGYRLVTARSSAVVLERHEQYEAFDLDPDAPSALPTIGGGAGGEPVPELETWVAMLVGLVIAGWWYRRK